MNIDKEQVLGELDDWMRGVSRALETAPEQRVDPNGEVAETVADLCEAVNRSPVEAAGLAMIPPVPDLSVLSQPDPTDSFFAAPMRREYELPEGELVQPERFKGEILTNATGGEYTFQEVLLEATGGAWATFTGARTGTAYEMNLNDAVEVGKVVEITEDSRAGGVRAWSFRYGTSVVQCDSVCCIKETTVGNADDTNFVNTTAMTNVDTLTDRQHLLVHFKQPFTVSAVSRIYMALALNAVWNWTEITPAPADPDDQYGDVYSQAGIDLGLILRDFDTSAETWNTFDPDTSEDTDWVMWEECERWLHGCNNCHTTTGVIPCQWPSLKNDGYLSMGPVGNAGHSDPATKVYGVLIKVRTLGEWVGDPPAGTGACVFYDATMTNTINLALSGAMIRGATAWPL